MHHYTKRVSSSRDTWFHVPMLLGAETPKFFHQWTR